MSESFDDETRKALTNYRMQQAEATLSDAELLLANDRLNAAANRLYYACFYATEALLIRNGIRAATHVGVRQMFGLHFTQTGLVDAGWGRFLTRVAQLREGADYDFFIRYDKDELSGYFPRAYEFLSVIRNLLQKDETIE